MKFTALNGREKKLKTPHKHLIDWDSGSRSKFQKQVKDLIFPHWGADVVFEEFPVVGTRMTLDFFNATRRIAIEVDGKQHVAYNAFMHGNSRRRFLEQIERDLKKEKFCEINNITFLRICHNDKLDTILTKENL